MKNKKIIVYCGIINWNRIKQRPQYLAEELSKTDENLVIYVNPPYSFFDLLVSLLKLSPKKVTFSLNMEINKKNSNLYVISLPLMLPCHQFKISAYINSIILKRILMKFLKLMKIKKIDILWLSYPNQYYLSKFLNFGKLVYDIMDDYLIFQKSILLRKQLAWLHERIVQKADLVLVSSRELLKLLNTKISKGNILLISNAVDPKLFDHHRNYEIPQPLRSIKKPIIGFIGYIGNWIDIDLIYETAKEYKNLSFVIIGPVHRGISNYKLDNIHFLGEKKHCQLPSYVYFFDICIIPFVKNSITDKVNPVKLFEFLSMNKPVVARETKELDSYKKYCYLYKSPQEFKKLLSDILRGKRTKTEICKSFIDSNTWSNRVSIINRAISGLLSLS